MEIIVPILQIKKQIKKVKVTFPRSPSGAIIKTQICPMPWSVLSITTISCLERGEWAPYPKNINILIFNYVPNE